MNYKYNLTIKMDINNYILGIVMLCTTLEKLLLMHDRYSLDRSKLFTGFFSRRLLTNQLSHGLDGSARSR